MKELEYPFDAAYIIKKRKSLKKALLADGTSRISAFFKDLRFLMM